MQKEDLNIKLCTQEQIIEQQVAEIKYLKNLINSLPGVIYWKDNNGVYLHHNNSAIENLKYLELPIESLVGKTDYDLFPKAVADDYRKNDTAVINNDVETVLEETIRLPNGRVITQLSIKKPFKDEHGNITGVVGNTINITQLKQRLFELKEAKEQAELTRVSIENRIQAIIDTIAGNHWWKDKAGHYLGCSTAVANALGFSSPVEVIGKTDYELPWSDTANYLVEHDKEVMANGVAQKREEIIATKTGERLIFMVVKTPLRDDKSNIIGTIGTSIDITEQKKAQAQLIVAKANEAKTEFIANMSHDLRTPLSGMVGMAEVLEKRIPRKDKKMAHEVVEAGKILLNLLNEVIDYIKIETNSPKLQDDQFEIRNVVKDIIDLMMPSVKQKKIKLDVHFDNLITNYLIGDVLRLHRILMNIVSNAVKFTTKGSININIELDEQYDETITLKITVKDTGIGIPEDQIDQIFTRFTRLTSAYQGNFKGSGLGLSIVKQFIKEMNGEIYVESVVNKGSKFICVLPFKKSLLNEKTINTRKDNLVQLKRKTKEESKSKIVEIKKHQQLTLDNKALILLVEDDLLAQKIAKINLEELNCLVDIASSGNQAIEMYNQKNYNLILMDIGLPDIDGYEVAKIIRDYEKNTNYLIPIIALTAHADVQNRQLCIQAGINEVVKKPLIADVAQNILNIYLKHQKIQQLSKASISENFI